MGVLKRGGGGGRRTEEIASGRLRLLASILIAFWREKLWREKFRHNNVARTFHTIVFKKSQGIHFCYTFYRSVFNVKNVTGLILLPVIFGAPEL